MKKLFALALLIFTLGPLLAADVADLIKMLRDPDSDTRRQAARALGEAGAQARSAAPALVKALHDEDLFVRRFAADALGKIDGDHRVTVPALALALRDPAREVQQAAAGSLGSMGPAAIPALVGTLTDSRVDAAVRARAAESLGKIGPAAKAAIPDLVAVLDAVRPGKGAAKKKGPVPTGDIRLEVVHALGDIATAGDKGAVEALHGLSRAKGNRDRTLKQAAAQAARRIEARKP